MSIPVIICLVLLYWAIGLALYMYYSRHESYLNVLTMCVFLYLWPLVMPGFIIALASALICLLFARGSDAE